MRIAKWILITVGGLVALLAATVFVITSVVDPNRYRGKFAGIVSDLAGRPFVIDGKIEITWYPWLGLHLGRAYLSDSAGGSGPALIEWQSAFVAAKVLPLLRGQLVVDRIRLQSPHVRLRRDAQGRGNWEDLGGSSREQGAPDASPVAPSASAAAKAAGRSGASGTQGARSQARGGGQTQIAGLEVRDAVIDYADETSGLRVNLAKMDFEMGEWRAGQSLPVQVRFQARGESLPANGIWVELDTPELGVAMQPVSVTAPKLTIRIADAVINGSLAYNQTAAGVIEAHGSLAVRAPSLRKLVADLALNQTMPHDPNTLGPLELTTQWGYRDGALAVKPLALKLDGVSFEGWVERGAPPRPGWRFELHGDRIDLGRYVNVDSTSQEPFELQMLKDIDANGSLIFDEALLADARLCRVRLQIQTSEPGLRRSPAEVKQ